VAVEVSVRQEVKEGRPEKGFFWREKAGAI
jgi:hypothetical protein